MAKFADNFEGWYKYAERARHRPPRPVLVEAMAHVPGRDAALDIGSGALNDARFLLDQGFARVTALDGEPIAQDIADILPADRFTYAIARFETFAFPVGTLDVLSAQYALPFIHPDHFDRVFDDLVAALKPGGVVVGQLFGDHDDWVGTSGMTFHSADAARARLEPLSVLKFTEEDRDSETLDGTPKHWHLFEFIARKD